jgi:hypothetical protein
MSVSQMLTHAQVPIRVAFGELRLKRTFVGYLFGRIAKKKLSGERQWQKNMPTDKNFVVTEQKNFEEEKGRLISLVQRFTLSGPREFQRRHTPSLEN